MIHSGTVLAMAMASLVTMVSATGNAPADRKNAHVIAVAANDKAPAVDDSNAESFTATYGDWQLQCAGASGSRNCQIIQTLVIQGQQQPFAQLGFGKLAKDGPLYFTAVVPVNVTFPSAVRIGIKKGDQDAVEVPYTRCLPSGCFASVKVDESMLSHWKAQTGAGVLMIKSGDGKDVSVPMSFRGLSRAVEAFDKES